MGHKREWVVEDWNNHSADDGPTDEAQLDATVANLGAMTCLANRKEGQADRLLKLCRAYRDEVKRLRITSQWTRSPEDEEAMGIIREAAAHLRKDDA